jgi:acetyl esterase/lipase
MVCASANYRLRSHVGYGEQLADVLAAIEWVRSRAREYGGDPDQIFLVGSSAGAYLAVDAVNAGTGRIAGIVGRYGYYGDLLPERPPPPILVIHGENDLLVRPSRAREFVERMRAGSSHSAEYVELPCGHHDFDLYESIRSNAVSIAVERFIMRSRGQGTEATLLR